MQIRLDDDGVGHFPLHSQTYVFGLMAVGCATFTSGFAGVYHEKIIKNGQQPSLLVRVIQLSTFAPVYSPQHNIPVIF